MQFYDQQHVAKTNVLLIASFVLLDGKTGS